MRSDIMTAMQQTDDAGTVQVVSRAEAMWRNEPKRQAVAKRTSFASGDFFKPGAHMQSLLQSGAHIAVAPSQAQIQCKQELCLQHAWKIVLASPSRHHILLIELLMCCCQRHCPASSRQAVRGYCGRSAMTGLISRCCGSSRVYAQPWAHPSHRAHSAW